MSGTSIMLYGAQIKLLAGEHRRSFARQHAHSCGTPSRHIKRKSLRRRPALMNSWTRLPQEDVLRQGFSLYLSSSRCCNGKVFYKWTERIDAPLRDVLTLFGRLHSWTSVPVPRMLLKPPEVTDLNGTFTWILHEILKRPYLFNRFKHLC